VAINPIRKMGLSNPRWGAPRIHGELLKLGFDLSLAMSELHLAIESRETLRSFSILDDNG